MAQKEMICPKCQQEMPEEKVWNPVLIYNHPWYISECGVCRAIQKEKEIWRPFDMPNSVTESVDSTTLDFNYQIWEC